MSNKCKGHMEVYRDDKGRFLPTSGKTRYKRKEHKGKNIQYSRWVWMESNGDIPDGCVIHHINGNKLDNRIENLRCMTHSEHNLLHSVDKKIWNKGVSKETNKKWRNALEKAKVVRNRNYMILCKEVYEFKNRTKMTYSQLVDVFGVCIRQLVDRYKHYERSSCGKVQ